MATVTTPVGQVFTEDDPTVLEYYRGEGYKIEGDTAVASSFPRVFDGEQYVGEQPVEVVAESGDDPAQTEREAAEKAEAERLQAEKDAAERAEAERLAAEAAAADSSRRR